MYCPPLALSDEAIIAVPFAEPDSATPTFKPPSVTVS